MNKHTLVIALTTCFAAAGVAFATAGAPANVQPAQSASANVGVKLSPAQRGALAAQIVRTWTPFVQNVQKGNINSWVSRMRGTFSAASDSNLQRAAGMKTFQGMMDALLGGHISDAQVKDSLALQARVLHSTGVVPALLGDVSDDLVYTPLAPCRIADTRVAGGPIASNSTRDFNGWVGPSGNYTAQGGSNTNCGVPDNPAALMINITAIHPTAAGYLTVFPFGGTKPLASNLNYVAGSTIVVGNEIAAKLAIGSTTSDFSVYAFGGTDVAIDVVGYFMSPQATPPNVQYANGTAIAVTDDGVARFATTGTCPTNFVAVSTHCLSTGSETAVNENNSGGCWFVDVHPGNGKTNSGTAQSVCIQVPGH